MDNTAKKAQESSDAEELQLETYVPDSEALTNTLMVPQDSMTIQSWQLTKMKYAFTRIEKNIFLKIVEVGQKYINRDYLGKDYKFEMENGFEGETPRIEFPIKDIAGNSHAYERIRDSLSSLSKKSFGVPKEEGWDFSEILLFSKIESSKNKGLMRVTLTNEFWKAFFNLKVFKIIDTCLAYKFRSVYTERIYEILVGNKIAVTYELDNLKKMFCLEEKYPNNNHFIKNVIISSQEEMKEMESCPFYFNYSLDKKGGRKISLITFTIVNKQEEQRRQIMNDMLKNDSLNVVLSDKVSQEVKKYFRLEMREDIEMKLKRAQKQLGVNALCTKIAELYEKAKVLKEKKELKGTMSAYFIGSLDRISEQKKEETEFSKTYHGVVEDTVPIQEYKTDGYNYLSNEQMQDKARLCGMTVEEMIKTFGLERVDNETWRMKA